MRPSRSTSCSDHPRGTCEPPPIVAQVTALKWSGWYQRAHQPQWHGTDEGGQAMNDHDLVRQLAGWRQTTAEILYRMPDHPGLVQTFLWQDMDRWDDDPRLTYPRLRQFCDWWNANLERFPIITSRLWRPGFSRR